MTHQPFRIQPAMSALSYKTYGISAPLATHFRPATCEEADCGPHQHGWRTAVDETSDFGQKQAYYIRKQSGRRFFEHRDDAGRTVFEFPAGQRCFQADAHRVPLEREQNFFVRPGDWRVNPRSVDTVRHTRPEFWLEDFGLHQQKLADRLKQG